MNNNWASAFNEWMRRYAENPTAFKTEYATMKEYLSDIAEGREPSYGHLQAAYFKSILYDLVVS